MTAQVEFYVLQGGGLTDKYGYACKLASEAYARGMKVWVHTDDERQSAALDKLLWTFAQSSFVPHVVCGDGEVHDGARYPVQIGHEEVSKEGGGVLISLRREVSEGYAGFERVVELVIDDEEDKVAGRERFRFYREQGVEPSTHNISSQREGF